MFSGKIIILVGLAGLLELSTAIPAPDSAGIVEMENGLAYGGIPYGSVSGMVAKYSGYAPQQVNSLQQSRQFALSATRPVIITPNYRATRLISRGTRPVQIYNLPGVIAPGVVGTISQIGF